MKKAGTAVTAIFEGQPAGIGGVGRNSNGTITINGGTIEAHTRNCEPAIRADKKYSNIDLGCHMNMEGVQYSRRMSAFIPEAISVFMIIHPYCDRRYARTIRFPCAGDKQS